MMLMKVWVKGGVVRVVLMLELLAVECIAVSLLTDA
jgi:hypothetical protein